MNSPKLRASKNWWDSVMPELIDLVTHLGYRLKDLAEHFNRTVCAIASALRNRGISLISLRYNYAKEQG